MKERLSRMVIISRCGWGPRTNTTQNMILSMTYCSEVDVPISFYY